MNIDIYEEVWFVYLFLRLPLLAVFSLATLGLSRQTTRRWLTYLAPLIGYGLGFSGHLNSQPEGNMIQVGTAILKSLDPNPQEPLIMSVAPQRTAPHSRTRW